MVKNIVELEVMSSSFSILDSKNYLQLKHASTELDKILSSYSKLAYTSEDLWSRKKLVLRLHYLLQSPVHQKTHSDPF